jgi:hypothetical protein
MEKLFALKKRQKLQYLMAGFEIYKSGSEKRHPFNPEESVDFAGIQGRLYNTP